MVLLLKKKKNLFSTLLSLTTVKPQEAELLPTQEDL